ncbi:MAG: uroporphyrinogen decarboxylase family protein [Candidatus Humimicrobiaceae bacterium]
MNFFEEFEEFAIKKEELLNDTYNFKNKDLPVIQTFDELKTGYSFGDMRKDRRKMLDQQLANISKTIKCKTDLIPFVEPWHAMGVYANSFGCQIKWSDNKDPDTLHVTDKPEDVYDLKPDLKNCELMNMTIDTIKFFQDKVGSSIPITTCDPNGPMLCASLILKTDVFLMSLMLNPKEMHHLIDLTTKVFIEFYERQLDLLKNPAFPGHNYIFSKNVKGVCVSEDNLAQLSPVVFEEFEVPALEKIADKFDGVYVHSCGNWMHNIDTVLKIKGLKGINFHSSPAEMDPEIVLKKIKASGKDITVFTDFGQVGINWKDNFKDEKDAYTNWFLKKICYDGIPKGVFITTFDNYPKITKYGYGYCRENISVEQASNDYEWIKNEIKKLTE